MRRDVVYVRQSDLNSVDLDKQAVNIMSHVSDLNNPIVMKEKANDSDRSRPVFQKLVNMVCSGDVNKVYVPSEDTLMKFGYNYLKTLFLSHCTDIVIVGNTG